MNRASPVHFYREAHRSIKRNYEPLILLFANPMEDSTDHSSGEAHLSTTFPLNPLEHPVSTLTEMHLGK